MAGTSLFVGNLPYSTTEGDLRDLMARRLTTRAFRRLRRQMNLLGVAVEQIFLLHESFYDEGGTALRPLTET